MPDIDFGVTKRTAYAGTFEGLMLEQFRVIYGGPERPITPPPPPITNTFFAIDGNNLLLKSEDIEAGWEVVTSWDAAYLPTYQMKMNPVCGNGLVAVHCIKIADSSLWLGISDDNGDTWSWVAWDKDYCLFFAHGYFISTKDSTFIISTNLIDWTGSSGAWNIAELVDIKYFQGYYCFFANFNDDGGYRYGYTNDLLSAILNDTIFAVGLHYWTNSAIDFNAIIISGSNLFMVLRDIEENQILIVKSTNGETLSLVNEIQLSDVESYTTGGNTAAIVENDIAFLTVYDFWTPDGSNHLIRSDDGGSTFNDPPLNFADVIDEPNLQFAMLFNDDDRFYAQTWILDEEWSIKWFKSSNSLSWTEIFPETPEGMSGLLTIAKAE